MAETTAVAEGQMPYWTEDNLDAALVYAAPLGGWHGDVVLKHVPAGVPNVIGSPVGRPHATRAAADDAVRRLLVLVLTVEARRRAAPPISAPPPSFLFFGRAVPLRADLLAAAPPVPAMPADELHAGAVAELESLLSRLFPGGPTTDAVDALTGGDLRELIAALHIAVLCGLYGYPVRTTPLPEAAIHSA